MGQVYLSAVGEFIEEAAKKQGMNVEFSAPAGHNVPSNYLGSEGYKSPNPVTNFPVELLEAAYDRANTMTIQAEKLGYRLMSDFGKNSCCKIFKEDDYIKYVDAGMSKSGLADPMKYFSSWEEAKKWLLEKQK